MLYNKVIYDVKIKAPGKLNESGIDIVLCTMGNKILSSKMHISMHWVNISVSIYVHTLKYNLFLRSPREKALCSYNTLKFFPDSLENLVLNSSLTHSELMLITTGLLKRKTC